MTAYLHAPDLTGQPFTATMSGVTVSTTQWDVVPEPAQTLTAKGGEINIYSSDIDTPSKGATIARSDGGTTLDLKGVVGPETITALNADGSPVEIQVLEQVSRDGWGWADHYMLETDPVTGDLIFEPGRVHADIYITESAAKYDAAKIAAEVGGGMTAGAVTGAWLRDNAIYGRSQAKAITAGLAIEWYKAMPSTEKVTPSPHFRFERDYTYAADLGSERHGESPLHPRIVSAWGTGAAPEGIKLGGSKQFISSNAVALGIMPFIGRDQKNILIADVEYDATGKGHAVTHSGQASSSISFYRAMIYKATKSAPSGTDVNGNPVWDDSTDRASGVYIDGTKGQMYEKCIFWHNGWGEGYGQNREGHLGQTPSSLSHNWYLSEKDLDTTIRNSMSIQGASTSWQFRSGGWLMNNISIDDCIHGSGGGSSLNNEASNRGVFSLMHRQVSTSAGYHKYNRQRPGAINWGMDLNQNVRSCLDTMIVHRANPDDPAEVTRKTESAHAYHNFLLASVSFNGVAWKWNNTDLNVDGLNATVLNQTTIQRFAASRTGVPTSIYEYGEYLTTLTPQERGDEIADAIEYFLGAVEPKLRGRVQDPYRSRATPVHQLFNAFEGSDGFRWDHPLHWSDRWVPGQNPLDSADLNGNTVKFLMDTSQLDSLTFGGGHLKVSSGKLTVGEHTDQAKVTVHNCGQYIAPLGSGEYQVRDGARLVLPDNITGISIEASGQSELCLPRNATVSSLKITGDMGWAGWDQVDGTASLTITNDLAFEVTPVLEFGYFGIYLWDLEVGRFFDGETSGFTAEYDCVRHTFSSNNTLHRVRVRNATGTPVAGEIVMRDDYLVKPGYPLGTVRTRTIQAVRPAEIGKLQRFRSGRNGLTNPAATVTVNLASGLTVSILGRQYLAPGTYDLGGGAGTGVTYVNQGATMPAGVTIAAGKLVLTV